MREWRSVSAERRCEAKYSSWPDSVLFLPNLTDGSALGCCFCATSSKTKLRPYPDSRRTSDIVHIRCAAKGLSQVCPQQAAQRVVARNPDERSEIRIGSDNVTIVP